MPKNLMIFTLGPVQEFIASARRSRDLWYGSWLLSDWSKTAARTVANQHGLAALIFPKPTSLAELEPTSNLGVANKIVAIIPGSPDEIARFAQDVEKEVRKRLDRLADAVFTAINPSDLDDLTTAKAQVADLLEFYWVAQPLADNEDNYANVCSYLEALIAARKATRDFRQLRGRPGYPKSSLDGLRESVVPQKRYPTREHVAERVRETGKDTEAVRKEMVNKLYHIYGAGPAEQLSGIDLLKRQGSKERPFPSTSHMAALPFLKRIDRTKTPVALDALLKTLDEYGVEPDIVKPDTQEEAKEGNTTDSPLGKYDGSLLYLSRLTESIKTESEKRGIAKALDKFLQEVGRDARPQPYYALLRADGDRMGATIDALKTAQEHAGISQALNGFAQQVAGIVASHEGAAVYSGGDDVLAFLPLHTALACAKELAQTFKEQLKGFTDRDGHSPTLSTGIAVTHYLEPLSDALRLAGEAEKAAKHVDGKHGLAIVVSKRSGVDRTVAGARLALNHRLTELIKALRAGAVPAGAAYQIQDMLVRMEETPGSSPQALRFETIRILQHKPSLRTSSREGTEKPQQMLKQWLLSDEVTPAELVSELIVAGFFADAEALAEGK